MDSLLSVLSAFAVVAAAAYVGTLRALKVYFDPDRPTVFLPDDHDPPNVD